MEKFLKANLYVNDITKNKVLFSGTLWEMANENSGMKNVLF